MGRKAFQLTSHSSINLLVLHVFALLLLDAGQCLWLLQSPDEVLQQEFQLSPKVQLCAAPAELLSLAEHGSVKGHREDKRFIKV